jgi:succinate-acetate transporter protein
MSNSIIAPSLGRSSITATVGFMALALMTWMLSMSNAGWYARPYVPGLALLIPLSVLLAIMGILTFIDLRVLDSVIFFGGAGLFFSDRAVAMVLPANVGGAEPTSYTGWYAIVWAVYFFYLWLASFRGEQLRMWFLLGAWLSLLALALGFAGLGHVPMVIGGYLGLATAVLAAVISARAINARSPGVTAAPEA